MRQGILALILLGLLQGCATGITTSAPATPTDDLPTPSATLDTTPVDVSTIMAQADQAYEQGDFAAAELAYLQVIAHAPDNASAQYRLGNTFARQQRYAEAIRAYQASLEQDAKQVHAYNNLATVYMYQAQAILASGVEHLPAEDGDTAQIKHMLWRLKKITPVKLRDMGAQAKNLNNQ